MARHYLDHASTSPLRPVALAAMVDCLEHLGGDPGRIHREGMVTRHVIESAREQVGTFFGARPREVVFTSGATESIAMAVWGASERGAHQVLGAVEHSAVRFAAERAGRVSVVGVDAYGRVDPKALMDAIEPDTALVHLQWANHEVATVQAVREVVAACTDRGVLVHVDAAQAAGHLPVAFDELGADFLSISAHKFGGPPGIGALLIRRGLRVRPLLLGGAQERARRAGLENTPAIVGFGATCAWLAEEGRLDEEYRRAFAQTEALAQVTSAVDGIRRYGHPIERAPHVLCLGIDGVEPQAVLLELDRRGIAVHAGSACASEDIEPSPVLAAIGADADRSLRVSVGWNTTDDDADEFCGALGDVVAKLRSYRG
jgi:cysteine desulfurase